MIASARVYHPGGLTLMGFLLSLLVYVVLLRKVRVVPLAERRLLVGLRSRTISVVHHHPSAKGLVDAADHRPTAETKTLAKGNPTTKAIVASHRPTAQTLFSSHHESRVPTHKPPHSVPGMSTNNQSTGAYALVANCDSCWAGSRAIYYKSRTSMEYYYFHLQRRMECGKG